MKKLLLTFILALIVISSLFALPLTALIKQCGDKPYYDEECTKKRSRLSGELGKFVALVNDELDGLRDISPDASDDFVQEVNGRRKIMELEVRNALHIIRCLGVPASDPQCGAESASIDAEKAALQTEYKQTHAAFDGTWISIPVSSPIPKKPYRPSFDIVPRIHMDEEVLSHISYRDFGERGFIRFSVNSPGGGRRVAVGSRACCKRKSGN